MKTRSMIKIGTRYKMPVYVVMERVDAIYGGGRSPDEGGQTVISLQGGAGDFATVDESPAEAFEAFCASAEKIERGVE